MTQCKKNGRGSWDQSNRNHSPVLRGKLLSFAMVANEFLIGLGGLNPGEYGRLLRGMTKLAAGTEDAGIDGLAVFGSGWAKSSDRVSRESSTISDQSIFVAAGAMAGGMDDPLLDEPAPN